METLPSTVFCSVKPDEERNRLNKKLYEMGVKSFLFNNKIWLTGENNLIETPWDGYQFGIFINDK